MRLVPLAGQLSMLRWADSSVLVIAGTGRPSSRTIAVRAVPGLSQAESMRPITKEARCAYHVHANPAAIPVATIRACDEATTAPTGPFSSPSAPSCSSRWAHGADRRGGGVSHRAPGAGAAGDRRAIARRLGEAQCPALIFGDYVWREGAGPRPFGLAEILEAPAFSTRQIFPNFPTRHPLYCGGYPSP